ncbi:hypothetical protein [Anaerolactibacter massiliensis]|uniref:hypothetical protein n=1 Tax=Anaerolactibacter massiliensis TaxID=2044573 RepID=UPI000CF90FD7|nr:hypothetical protein [Anaerolactibacter massiliensis]
MLLQYFKTSFFFAERYNDLDQYARIRGTGAETVRDTVLSDTGLSADGTKAYDLGNQIVAACLQPDLSFIVKVENGRTVKSISKKESDDKLYAESCAEFS